MGHFDDMLAAVDDVFLDTFAERQMVVYRPRGGLPRSIRAIVDRPPPEVLQEGKPAQVHGLLLTVANDPLRGIAAAEFNADGDTVALPVRMYDLPAGRPLHFYGGIVAQDGGMLTVRAVP